MISNGGFLQLSFQLLITIAFNQTIKLHSLKIQGPGNGKCQSKKGHFMVLTAGSITFQFLLIHFNLLDFIIKCF